VQRVIDARKQIAAGARDWLARYASDVVVDEDALAEALACSVAHCHPRAARKMGIAAWLRSQNVRLP
jgi:hypothetical protein